MHHLDGWIKRDQLDVTCFIISLFNAQHVSDINTSILRSLRLICWVISWVVLRQQSHNFPHPGRIACCSARNSRSPASKALHTIRGNNTIIVSSSWWWAYKCPKHVEQIISAINHSVASSWFYSLRLYNDARKNIHQIHMYCTFTAGHDPPSEASCWPSTLAFCF